MSRVLVIDDDASLRFTLEAVLSDAGLVVEACDGGASGLAAFELHGADVVLTDLAMPEMDGMQVLARMRAADPSVPVMMLTAHGSERVAVAAMKAGAFDYIPKPFDPDELALAVRRATDWRDLRLQNARLRTEAALGRTIIAQSPAMTRVMDMVTRVAPKDVTVLLTGESGAGKDVLATVLQAHSRRAPTSPSSDSTRPPSRASSPRPSFSGTRAARSRAPRMRASAISSRRTKARCSSTRSASCPRPFRPRCSGRCNPARSSKSAAAPRWSTSASSRRPTAISWRM